MEARAQGAGGAAERGVGFCGGRADVEAEGSLPGEERSPGRGGDSGPPRPPRLASPSRTQNPDVCPTGSSAGPPVTPCPGAGPTCRSHADPSLGVKFKLLTEVRKSLPGGRELLAWPPPEVSSALEPRSASRVLGEEREVGSFLNSPGPTWVTPLLPSCSTLSCCIYGSCDPVYPPGTSKAGRDLPSPVRVHSPASQGFLVIILGMME